MKTRIALASLLVLAACGDSRLQEPTSKTQSPILSGTPDTAHPAVVAIDAVLSTGEELCTGYLITPDLVLTARHCAAPVVTGAGGCAASDAGPPNTGGPSVAIDKINVFVEAILEATSKPLAVAEVSVLPDSEGAALCGTDLAILRLAVPLTTIAPIPLRVTGPPEKGETFAGVGYGSSKPAPDDDSGIRRSREGLSVAAIGATTGARTLDGEWTADQGPCAGDSGGPAIAKDGASFGVMSRGVKSTCQNIIYQRLDVHADWLIQQARASAARLGTPAVAWAAAVDDAGTDADASPEMTPPSDASTETPAAPASLETGCSLGIPAKRSNNQVWLVALAVVALLFKRRNKGNTKP